MADEKSNEVQILERIDRRMELQELRAAADSKATRKSAAICAFCILVSLSLQVIGLLVWLVVWLRSMGPQSTVVAGIFLFVLVLVVGVLCIFALGLKALREDREKREQEG